MVVVAARRAILATHPSKTTSLRHVSSLVLVRHAQASLHADDYDNLSARGVQQSRRLGEAFVERGLRFDAVYIGPQRRHAQTLEHAAATTAGRGLSLPEPTVLDGLAEIDASALGEQAMREATLESPDFRERAAKDATDPVVDAVLRRYLRRFEELMKEWSEGRHHDRVESHELFSRRVVDAMQTIMRTEGRARLVLVVTSGGPVSVAARHALGAEPDKGVELLFALQNASVTELRYTEERLSLVRFNEVGHLPASMITGI